MEELASGRWLSRERVTVVAAISGAIGLAMLLFLFVTMRDGVDLFGEPIGTDFSVFWNAGHLANSGRAADAWDPNILNATAHATHGRAVSDSAWIYPPPFLFVASPLASLPYVPALLVWQLVSLAAIALTLAAILQRKRDVLVALASPLTPMVLAHGQNAFLTASLLGTGLLLLERRPAAAGAAFGALVYKPQLALLVGPLLLLRRSWRSAFVGAAVAITLIGSSALIWGTESWRSFIASLKFGRLFMEQGSVGFHKSGSLFAMSRQWGATIPLSYAVQLLGLCAALFLLWHLRKSRPKLLAAGVCAGVVLSTPYLLDYEMALVGIGAALLFADSRTNGFARYERTLLAAVWIAPWFSRHAAQYLTLPLAQMVALLFALLVAIKASSSRRSHEASAP